MNPLRELWLSFIGAFIRFFDNRFNKLECQACKVLQTEVARLQDLNSSLVDRLLSPVPQPTDDLLGVTDAKLEPKLSRQVPWEVKRRELELAHRKPVKGNDLATFEENLKELTGAN